MDSYEYILTNVLMEIKRAKKLHGDEPFHSAHEGFAVLDEERDELWDEVKTNPMKAYANEQNPRMIHKGRMKKEAIQLAAMAVRFAAEVC